MKDFEDANVDLFISYGINDLEKFEKWLLNDVKNHLIIIEDEKKNFENI